MTVQIAHLYASLCGAIVAFQIALIAGAPLGPYTQGGQHPGPLPRSGRIIAALSIPVLVFQALAMVSAAGFRGAGLAALDRLDGGGDLGAGDGAQLDHPLGAGTRGLGAGHAGDAVAGALCDGFRGNAQRLNAARAGTHARPAAQSPALKY